MPTGTNQLHARRSRRHPRFGPTCSLRAWVRLLARHRIPPRRWPDALLATPFCLLHSALGALQRTRYAGRLAAIEPHPEPVFILGHWRTGTTLLHELMATDARFSFPSTYACVFPHHHLLTERMGSRLLALPPNTVRGIDAMPMGWRRPQEEEYALYSLGMPSPYLAVGFPRELHAYDAWLTLDDVSPADRARWMAVYLRFLKQVTLARPGPLVLKSPLHTFRIRLLLELFPRARFVHLVRDPFAVFASSVHALVYMAERYGLQPVERREVEDYVLWRFGQMHAALERDRALIPAHRLCEVRYEELVRDPPAALRGIYAALGLPDFGAAEAAIRDRLADFDGYRPNRLTLSDARRRDVQRQWAAWIDRYGYAPA